VERERSAAPFFFLSSKVMVPGHYRTVNGSENHGHYWDKEEPVELCGDVPTSDTIEPSYVCVFDKGVECGSFVP
jgi:hypothetical protein